MSGSYSPSHISFFLLTFVMSVRNKKNLKSRYISPVHVVLVSLLVNQLSGLFLTFFGWPKKNCTVSGNFWSGSDFFGQPNFFLVYQKFPETDQKFPETGQLFFGWPRDWPKPHGRDFSILLNILSSIYIDEIGKKDPVKRYIVLFHKQNEITTLSRPKCVP